MVEKIFLELFIIKETAKGTWDRLKWTKSLVAVWSMYFGSDCRYQINDDEWVKGNYYQMNRAFWGALRKGD